MTYVATKERLLALEKRCLRIEQKLQSSLSRLEGWDENNMHLYLSPEDKLRLLNLNVWSLRYGVSIDYILTALLQHYFVRHRRKNRYLGIRVSALMSKPSEEFLEEAIRQEFPNNEMEQERQEREKRRVNRILKTQTRLKMETVNPDVYEDQWQKRDRMIQRQGRGFSRSWRGNLWR